jgi:ketosteroid isomerase-like protein
MKKLVLITSALVLMASPTIAQDKATFQEMADQFSAAFNKGEIGPVVEQYNDNSIVLPPGSQMVKGKSNIEKFWKGAMEGIGNVKVTVVEVKPLGPNAAREIGTITARTKGQSPQDVTGKYVVVWEKVGNEWKNTSDIWNMDK